MRTLEGNKDYVKFMVKCMTRVIIVAGFLMLAHEFGHLICHIILGTELEWMFLEEGINRGDSYGLILGFSRRTIYDFPTELWIRIISPLFFQLVILIVLKYRVGILFRGDAFPIKIYSIYFPCLMIADVLILIQDISFGLW